MVGLVAGALFVLIGLFVVIPAVGGFGIIWTLFAVAITAVNGYNAFSEKGVATHEIVVDDEEDYFSAMPAPAPGTDDATARLNKLKESCTSRGLSRARSMTTSAGRSCRSCKTSAEPCVQGDICGAKSVVLRPGFSRALTELPVLQTGSFAPLRMTPFLLSFWGKTVTAAGGGRKEQFCGGDAEL